ncbi:MAG TPA: hypothetical protein VGG33_15565, partial [Polyangia bacterium]
MNRAGRSVVLAVILPFAFSCASACAPSGAGNTIGNLIGGAGGSATGGEIPGGSTGTCEPTTAGMYKMFAERCAGSGCHGSKEPIVGLDLVSPGMEQRLINVVALGCRPDRLVIPGDPDKSLMYQKVADLKPECGVRMPIAPPHLAIEEVECLRRWITGLAASPLPTVDAGSATETGAAVDASPIDTRPVGLTCPSGQTACGDRCYALTQDNANCGACGRTCSAGTSCVNGTCACPSGSTLCGSACVELTTSNSHCGACGRACSGSQTCNNGTCGCSAGLMACG